MGYATHRIQSMKELEKFLPKMAKAKVSNVHIDGTTDVMPIPQYNSKGHLIGFVYPEGYWSEDVKAVVNNATGEYVQSVTPQYAVLQHDKYYGIVINALRELGYNKVYGSLTEQNNWSNVSLRLIFEGVTIEEVGRGQNIGVGGEFSNSFDSKFAARGAAYFMRFNCENQMILKNVIPEAVFARIHLGASEDEIIRMVSKDVKGFVNNLVDSGATFKRVMTEAMTDEVKLESYNQLEDAMVRIFKVQSHAESIAQRAWENAVRPWRGAAHHVIDRWDLYNAASSYCSDPAIDLSPQVQNTIMYRAENQILSQSVSIPAIC